MKPNRNDPCWCGSGLKYKKCHEPIDEKIAFYKSQGHIVPSRKLLKTPEQIEGIRQSSKINIAVLDAVSQVIRAGMTTEEINTLVDQKTREMGGIPAPLNYEGFPKSVCVSINDQVCHGIPSSDDVLKEGDIVNVDVSTIYQGYFSDASRMFLIGEVKPEWKKLVEVTKQAVEVGLVEVKPWAFLGDMGQAIHDFVRSHGYTVVEEIGGHGVGLQFHEDPFVSYVSKKGTEMLMVPGMVFTIEPMVNLGKRDVFVDAQNDWTIYTQDGSPSAQWEITVAVTETGHEVLTW